MKAIILLELDDEWLDINNFNIDELLADITLYHDLSLKRQCDYTQRIYRCFSPLKPMPKKNKYDVEQYITLDYETNISLGHYLNIGWNDCIDELLEE